LSPLALVLWDLRRATVDGGGLHLVWPLLFDQTGLGDPYGSSCSVPASIALEVIEAHKLSPQ